MRRHAAHPQVFGLVLLGDSAEMPKRWSRKRPAHVDIWKEEEENIPSNGDPRIFENAQEEKGDGRAVRAR